MDLGGVEKQSFSTVLLKNSRKCHGMAWISVNYHKVSSFGSVFGLDVVVPS